MRISDWSSDVCSSDLARLGPLSLARQAPLRHRRAGARGRERRDVYSERFRGPRQMKKGRSNPLRAIFAVPRLPALVSSVGLVVALNCDCWRAATSCSLLALTPLAVGWAQRARRPRTTGCEGWGRAFQGKKHP